VTRRSGGVVVSGVSDGSGVAGTGMTLTLPTSIGPGARTSAALAPSAPIVRAANVAGGSDTPWIGRGEAAPPRMLGVTPRRRHGARSLGGCVTDAFRILANQSGRRL
jgi:hypothetical protein